MKGKNKFVLALFAVIALVASSVVFALNGAIEGIMYAKAATVEAFTTELEGGVIFSAERVYFAVDDKGGSSSTTRSKELSYRGYTFNPIETNQGTEYFADYGLTGGNGTDNAHKDIIKDGEFVMVDDDAVYTANIVNPNNSDTTTDIKQGIMITLGGYYYIEGGNIGTNSQVWGDTNNDGEDDGFVKATEEVGACLDYVSAQATLNGNPIDLPNARGYNNSSYQDFTWFIVPDETTEGHYEISVLYMVEGLAQPLRYDFDFYLLLQSSYNKEVKVESSDGTQTYVKTYPSSPTIGNATAVDVSKYAFFSGTSLNYPTITFDYARYDLTYTHTSGDKQTTVNFDYDETTQTISLAKEVYNDKETKQYLINHGSNNTIVTLMFVDNGKYDIHFDYIYKYQGGKITIPQEQISFENINLNIYGYQLKYSKAGFASADMTYLEIYQNNTMFILVNGFTDANDEAVGDNLGVQYKLINDITQKTGVVKDSSNSNFNEDSESAGIIRGINSNDIDDMLENDTTKTFLDNIKYQKTDRGLWLTLSGSNSEYYFENNNVVESFYYYHPSRIINEDFVKGVVDANGNEQQMPIYTLNRKNFSKVTTFTAPGYYLAQVKYVYDSNKIAIQYFAFQITATTPILNLYKIDSETLETDNFYAHEYTNQNVYAYWAETEIFESTVVGKLYYANGKYASESELKAVANGSYSSSVTKVDYAKNTLIENSGSYLLVLEVERSATKTYTYFTIDKDAISGLEVYEVVTNSIDNRAIYSIKQDDKLNYVKHTSNSVINTTFTLDWADKASGAKITASYKFTPFVKDNKANAGNAITITQGANTYKYIINEYVVGQTSNNIEIHKPTQLNSALDVNNVLIDQGIYEFYLVDQAGNELVYIVVVDNTEGVINATYGEEKTEYFSGQMVADYVELEWGTHKAINLGSNVNDAIKHLLTDSIIENYYSENGNNWFNLVNMFQTVADNNLFVVQNLYTDIKLRPFDEYQDKYYRLNSAGTKQIKHPNGVTTTGWDDIANKLFENANNMGIKINVDAEEVRRYTFEVVGSNSTNMDALTSFAVYITPDKAQGEVYSSTQEDGDYSTSVMAYGGITKYFNDNIADENVNIEKYYRGQASNDGVFVFEWLVPSDEDNFKVTEVKYNYYQLMDQNTLNKVTELTEYPYYPYTYISTNYILKIEEDIETVSQYSKITRTINDSKGNILESRSVNQSEAINLAYETYYDTNGNLVSKKVTQTGLYIITRTIEMNADDGSGSQTNEFSYAFFVDRNMIVGYSITDINEKIVGQFIHTAMPNSKSANGITYDNFTKQGLKTQTQTYYENNKEKSISYQVYLETNKLPTQLQVPSGKYVSGDMSNKSINYTSYMNLKLKLSVYFVDSYNILPNVYKGAFVKLMNNMTANKNGYIDLSFSNIENPGILTEFRNSRIHNEDVSLSLPGTYIFVIEDTVSKKLNEQFEVIDTNNFIFGIKLTNQSPTTDVYTYAKINNIQSDKVYAEDNILYTNQEFVDFVIPVEDLNSYNAQLDIASIEIWRSSSDYGGSSLWLRLKAIAGGYGFTADTNGIIQNLDRIEFVQENGKLVGYTIKLDTGLTVENNQIVDYKEYVYTINIQYILTNSGTKYYTYKSTNDDGNAITNSFYSSTYTVTIDRTPNSTNLNSLMDEQGNYFENYHNWLAKENNVDTSRNVNENFAYRSTKTVNDYYGLANDLYYQFASNSGTLSNEAMYALNVGYSSTFNPTGLSEVYYRQLDFNANIDANRRMGLLPITNTYFETSEYYTFNESLTAYNRYYTQSNVYQDGNGNIYYWAIMRLSTDANGSYETSYNNRCGVFYEIIEKDMAGNYTQYVIYFAPSIASDVNITLSGKVIGNEETPTSTLTFTNNTQVEQRTFIGIDSVELVDGIVGDNGKGQLYPYYANINIYNASRENIKTIYTNSTSQHIDDKGNGFEAEIYNVIKEQGNYIIEYVNTFGERRTIIVNNYTNDKHQLNVSTLEVKTDPMTGQKYITFSGLNSKIDDNTYWYVNRIEIIYNFGSKVVYIAGVPTDGITHLEFNEQESNTAENEITRSFIELDRLNLAKGIQYLVNLTDVGGNIYAVPLSTSENYYAYKLIAPNNVYTNDNIMYTANQIQLSYNTDFYEAVVEVYLDGNTIAEVFTGEEHKNYYTKQTQASNYNLLTLLPDSQIYPANYYGSLRRFIVTLVLKADDKQVSQSYEIYIDTRITDFAVENTNKVDKIDYIKSTLNNNNKDYNVIDLRGAEYYEKLITETINISWTRLTSDYFTYNYQLFEFVSADEYVELLKGSSDNKYSISPKENSTGKYILKVTISSKNGNWIASRIYGIYMSTTITGLYEVKDNDGNLYDYTSVTNLEEVRLSIGGNVSAMATSLGFKNSADMEKVFNSFGLKTAIPMYIANTTLTLHSNQDNGVNSRVYIPTGTSYAQISFYRIFRSNYQTFAVIMEVYKTDQNQNILSTLSFFTTDTTYETLLNNGTATTIYNTEAEYYKLTFDSYNRNTGSNLLERHNKIIIDIYYNNVFAKRVKGDRENSKSFITFNNSGSYTLKIRDEAGNIQYFNNGSVRLDNFTVVVMKDILYTVNGEAPIQYAYYDSAVTLQINRYNEATGRNNYDINTIRLNVIRNSAVYTGYEHPAESATYIFKDYGTYLVTISAKLLGTDVVVTSQLVFTILNPNEARTALDFTSIYGYNIISVFSITKTAEKDVTDKFIDLLQDKSNTGEINVYNKLITYERLVSAFGSSTQGKMKFRVLYEVENDDLLPARVAEFSFTLNNETATINSSIKPGGKTTDEVSLKFNAANIYDQIGDCNLVINGEVVLRIDEKSSNSITEIRVTEVGKYYIQLMGDSGNITTSFNFTIKEPLNAVSIILIVVVAAIVIALIGTFIWLRTRMKVR